MTEFLAWQGWITLIIAACWIGVGIAVAFVVRYHVQTHGGWRDTPAGRWLLYGRALIASVLALTLINYYFPTWPAQLPVSFLLMALYVAHLWWPHVLLTRAQRERREREQERIEP